MDELARALLGWRLRFRFFDGIAGFILRGRLVRRRTRCPFGFEPSELISQALSSGLLRSFIIIWHDRSTRFHVSLGWIFRAAQVEGSLRRFSAMRFLAQFFRAQLSIPVQRR
jgi:hypothetical protein